MISMVILGFVLAGTFAAFYAFSTGLKLSLSHLDRSEKNQAAFESIRRDLRSVSDVHQASGTAFEFTTSDLSGSTERIRLYYDAEQDELIATSVTTGSSRVLLEGVQSASFTYYDRFGNETTTMIDINATRLVVETQRETMNGQQSVNTDTAIITFRNRLL